MMPWWMSVDRIEYPVSSWPPPRPLVDTNTPAYLPASFEATPEPRLCGPKRPFFFEFKRISQDGLDSQEIGKRTFELGGHAAVAGRDAEEEGVVGL
jgi:hypothetical protein